MKQPFQDLVVKLPRNWSTMRVIFISFAILSSILSIITLLNELFQSYYLGNILQHNSSGLPKNSKTAELITDHQKFITSQVKAVQKRESRIPQELFRHICLLGSSSLFLSMFLRKKLQRVISEALVTFPKLGLCLNIKEGITISIIVTLIVASVLGDRPFVILGPHAHTPFFSALFYVLLCFFVIPILYIFIRKLLSLYSDKLIIACYMAYFIKATCEFLTLEDVNLEAMKGVDVSEFSQHVRDYLVERRLQNRVYSEKVVKSRNINAALIGWGVYERIEIYGDYKQLTDNEFDAVLMHEIGHSEDYSLIKKLAVLFFLKALEMLFMIYVYSVTSRKFSDDDMTRYGAFMVLFIIYFLLMNKWLLVAHKMVSQLAETSADAIAKSRGYGKELSKVLYDITVKGETPLQTTWLFNVLKSYHPTIYDRIEHLRS